MSFGCKPATWIAGLLMGCLLMACPALAADDPFTIKLPFKTAIIKYTLEGNTSGSQVTYYQGRAMATHTKSVTKVLGMSSDSNTIVIADPKRVVTVDLKERTARATGNMTTYLAEEYAKLSPAEKATVKRNAESMGHNFAQAIMGGKPRTSTGAYLGRPVTITKIGDSTIYSWKGYQVPLKSSVRMMGITAETTATSVKTGVAIPAEAMRVPAGFKVVFDKEADRQQRAMAKRIIAKLKDPNASAQSGAAGAEDAPAKSGGSGAGEAVDQGVRQLKKLFSF